uniref:Uncharacterized protein LOC114346600 n=1 Tax=Diabrotica virgifera virgifera TaxID=50390 RepID=A0A6P7GUF1_DIAVI
MSETLLCIKGSLVDKEGSGVVKLANNVGAFLFDSCTYSESAREMETVRDPGIVSAVRAMTCYNQEDSNYMVMSGWNYPNSPILHDTSFNILMPLKHIFNIFNDYPLITCGRQTIRLVRARNDNDCLIITDTVTTAKININIELRVKHIYPNDEIKLQLMKSIQEDRPIVIPFRKWELHELPLPKVLGVKFGPLKLAHQLKDHVMLLFSFKRENVTRSKLILPYLTMSASKVLDYP